MKTYFIHTFGCQQNLADSERLEASYKNRGMKPASSIETADHVVINTCMVRASAEHRVYGMVHNLGQVKQQRSRQQKQMKIVVTGCMVGIAMRDSSGKYLELLRKRMPAVDEFLPIEEVGFESEPIRQSETHAWVPISNGCNNFCTFCIVPFTRGREISRPYETILTECQNLTKQGYESVTLLGQNVNSYGADLILGPQSVQALRDLDQTYFPTSNQTMPESVAINGTRKKPVYVSHLGRQRIPTLFPHLLEDVAQLGFSSVEFMSSNPWDFTDELIEVIAANPNISRQIHLPVQSGDATILKRMNRWYSPKQYLELVKKLKQALPDIRITTDIIVGFPGESEKQFDNTVALAESVGFHKAYIGIYSERPMTAATKVMSDDVPHKEKRRRWNRLNRLINTDFSHSPSASV